MHTLVPRHAHVNRLYAGKPATWENDAINGIERRGPPDTRCSESLAPTFSLV